MLRKLPKLIQLPGWGSEARTGTPAASFCPLKNTSGESLLEQVTVLREPPPWAEQWRSHTPGRTPAGLKQAVLGKAGCEQLSPIPYCSILKTEYPTLPSCTTQCPASTLGEGANAHMLPHLRDPGITGPPA